MLRTLRRYTDVRPDPQNAQVSIYCAFCKKLESLSDVQPLNALPPMNATVAEESPELVVSNREMELRLEQPKNAPDSILVMCLAP